MKERKNKMNRRINLREKQASEQRTKINNFKENRNEILEAKEEFKEIKKMMPEEAIEFFLTEFEEKYGREVMAIGKLGFTKMLNKKLILKVIEKKP